MRQAKILITLGPKSSDIDILRQLVLAGATGVRLNFSHGSEEDHRMRADTVRKLSRELGLELSLLGDLCGPKLRIGRFASGSVSLLEGANFTLVTANVIGDEHQVSISHELDKDLSVGTPLLLDDGLIGLIVTGIEPGRITCRVTTGGVLSDRKGLNVPNVRLSVSAITVKDERDLAVGRELGVDWFALSFVRDAADVRRCKVLAGNVPVIAKLEKPEAVESLAEIIDASDGIMVARGDLGVEAGLERVPVIQKRAIELANRQGKLVITATQMLESMIHHPRPTRAEASDVANAIFDGSDVVMLSGETAVGAYPVETVKMMASIIEHVEQSEPYLARALPDVYGAAWQSDNATARAAATLSRSVKLAAIVVLANDEKWLDILADYRPLSPIVALVADTAVARRSALQWGVVSRVVEMPESQRDLIALSEAKTRECVGARSGDDIAILAPSLPEGAGKTLTLWKIR